MHIRKLLTPVIVAIAAVFVASCATDGGAIIISGYGDYYGPNGYPRNILHRGIDFQGDSGDPVIAAAGGMARTLNNRACGIGVRIFHTESGKYTLYCHFSKWPPSVSEKKDWPVTRGEIIGYIGRTGAAGIYPHVHFGYYSNIPYRQHHQDPTKLIIGCYEKGMVYMDKQLTYPVPCINKKK